MTTATTTRSKTAEERKQTIAKSRAWAYKTTGIKSPAPSASDIRAKAIAEELDARKERREQARMQRAKDAGRRFAHNDTLNGARTAKDAKATADDAEADASEAKALGKQVAKVIPKAKPTPQAQAMQTAPVGKHHAEYRRLMKAGESRLARRYWRENESTIQEEAAANKGAK